MQSNIVIFISHFFFNRLVQSWGQHHAGILAVFVRMMKAGSSIASSSAFQHVSDIMTAFQRGRAHVVCLNVAFIILTPFVLSLSHTRTHARTAVDQGKCSPIEIAGVKLLSTQSLSYLAWDSFDLQSKNIWQHHFSFTIDSMKDTCMNRYFFLD